MIASSSEQKRDTHLFSRETKINKKKHNKEWPQVCITIEHYKVYFKIKSLVHTYVYCCDGFYWDRVNFLHTDSYHAVLDFLMKIVVETLML